MYWSSRGYGVYLHNWWRSRFGMGQFNSGRVEISADGGEMDFYIFYGPSLKQIVNRYTELTGRPALLPKWVFGYHQGGAGNDQTSEWASNIAKNMRKNRLPMDVIYYDDVDPTRSGNSYPTIGANFNGPGVSIVARLTATASPTLLNEFVAS